MTRRSRIFKQRFICCDTKIKFNISTRFKGWDRIV
jgi:hypothetical protein